MSLPAEAAEHAVAACRHPGHLKLVVDATAQHGLPGLGREDVGLAVESLRLAPCQSLQASVGDLRTGQVSCVMFSSTISLFSFFSRSRFRFS